MLHQVSNESFNINCTLEEYWHIKELEQRKLYLTYTISSLDCEDSANEYLSGIGQIIQNIMCINEEDKSMAPQDRKPIRIFINSPGGDVTEGFPLISAIELSKTPVYTINIGIWASMAFWIGIAGHRRFALPYTEFLLHEGTLFTAGPAGSVQDTVEFDKRFRERVVKKHVLKHSNMTEKEYDATLRHETYMLPEDALKHGFIDEIVNDIDTIL